MSRPFFTLRDTLNVVDAAAPSAAAASAVALPRWAWEAVGAIVAVPIVPTAIRVTMVLVSMCLPPVVGFGW
jgi:hypothetical protein